MISATYVLTLLCLTVILHATEPPPIDTTKQTAIELYLRSPERPELLKPNKDKNETIWFIKACRECKIIINCVFTTKDCLIASIMTYSGVQYSHVCPDETSRFRNASFGNYMIVTIYNTVQEQYAYCTAKTTPPFVGIPHKPIDSSEFGQSRTAKKKKTCKCGWSNKPLGRIIGGKETGINEFPFIAHVRYKEMPQGFCGGSIITDKHILSAAHCFYHKEDYEFVAVVGEHDLMTKAETTATREIDVEKIIVHKNYDQRFDYNDIAILVLKELIPFSVRVGPVCIPEVEKDYTGQFVKVMGWGLTRDSRFYGKTSPVLKKADLRVIDIDICKTFFNSDRRYQFCAFNDDQDTCAGDSGGPLVAPDPETNMYYQIGLVSFGRECGSTDPSVNTAVASYVEWIKEQIQATAPNSVMCN